MKEQSWFGGGKQDKARDNGVVKTVGKGIITVGTWDFMLLIL